MVIILFLYLILFVCSVFFYIMYRGDLSLYLMLLVFATPIVMFISLLLTRRKVRLSLHCRKEAVSHGSQCPVILKIENRSMLAVSGISVFIKYKNLIDGKEQKIRLNLPLHFKNTEEICLKLSSDFCGRIVVSLEKARIYDLLRLFSLRIKCKNQKVSFCIYPKLYPLLPQISHYSNPLSESDRYSKHRTGEDPSEIFGLHEYVPGDRMSRIHWKASVKEDKLIVKDFSLPLGNNIGIFICTGSIDTSLSGFDRIMSVASSLSLHLSDNEVTHTIFWQNEKSECSHLVTDNESYKQFLALSLSSGLSKKPAVSAYGDYLKDLGIGQANAFSHAIIICQDIPADIALILSEGDFMQKQTFIITDGVCGDITAVPENAQIISLRDKEISVLSDMII